MSRQKKAIKAVYFSLFSNASLAVVKYIAGVLGHSQALMADAVESASDAFSSLLLLLGFKYASRPADENHPYGHGRVEPLVTFVLVAFLVATAFYIAYESILNIIDPQKTPHAATLIILAAIILWKEYSYYIINKKSKDLNSTALKADAWHHRIDALSSVAAFIGIFLSAFLGDAFKTADAWAALFASGVILFNCYKLSRPALAELMDEHVYDDLVEDIRVESNKVKGVIDTEKCYVRKTGMIFHVDLHAIVDGEITVKEGHDISHQLKDHLKNEIPSIGDVLIHVEPYNPNLKEV